MFNMTETDGHAERAYGWHRFDVGYGGQASSKRCVTNQATFIVLDRVG